MIRFTRFHVPARTLRRYLASPGGSLASFALAVLIAIVAALATDGSPLARAQSEGNGLQETSVNTFLFDAERGVLRVTIDVTLTNVTTDRRDGNVIRQQYFDSYFAAIPLGAANIVATRNGQVLDGELTSDPEFPAFSYYEFALDRRVFSGQSTTVQVTYDHLGADPRNEVPWRVNEAYASYVAFGIGDDEDVTINIVLPAGYEFDEFTDLDGYDVSEPDGFGSVTYTRSGLSEDFETIVGMSNDGRLTSTPLDIDGVDIELRSWPDDPEWTQFATDRIEAGIPALEELIGEPWPVEGDFDVRQTVEPNLYGYAGWFDESSREIAVGEELDADTIYHELSHAWFNSDLAPRRWLTEGLAQVYAAELVERDGAEPAKPIEPVSTAPGFQRLDIWSSFTTSSDQEEYGYNASFWVVDALVDEIGFDATADVIAAMNDDRSPYDPSGQPATTTVDWRRIYDLFTEVGGSTVAAEVMTDYVVSEAEATRFAPREQAAADYAALVERSAPWAGPVGVRQLLESWQFDDFDAAVAIADEALARRDELDALIDSTGVAEPDETSAAYAEARRANGSVDFSIVTATLDDQILQGEQLVERQATIRELATATTTSPPTIGTNDTGVDAVDNLADFETAIAAADEQVDTLERFAATLEAQQAATGFVDSIGLWGTDVDADVDRARTAVRLGDNDAARAALDTADQTIASAASKGQDRITYAAIAAGSLLLLAVILIIRRWRRKRAARPSAASGSRLVGAGELLGRSSVDLDEDAFAGAHLSSVDDSSDVTIRDERKAP